MTILISSQGLVYVIDERVFRSSEACWQIKSVPSAYDVHVFALRPIRRHILNAFKGNCAYSSTLAANAVAETQTSAERMLDRYQALQGPDLTTRLKNYTKTVIGDIYRRVLAHRNPCAEVMLSADKLSSELAAGKSALRSSTSSCIFRS